MAVDVKTRKSLLYFFDSYGICLGSFDGRVMSGMPGSIIIGFFTPFLQVKFKIYVLVAKLDMIQMKWPEAFVIEYAD